MFSLHKLPLWFASAVALFVVGACAPQEKLSRTDKPAAHERQVPKLVAVQALINKRQHLAALELVDAHIRRHPNDAAAHYLAGEACFYLARYRKATGHFRQSLRIEPNAIDARHRLWAAELQAAGNSQSAKQDLRNRLMQLRQEQGDRPSALIAAYYGYGYLWDQSKQQQLIMSVSRLNLSTAEKERVGQLLVTEIILARTSATRETLARLYLDQYFNTADNEIAAQVLFAIAASKGKQAIDTAVERYARPYSADPYVNYYAAQALISTGAAIDTAISLLRRNLESTGHGEVAETHYRILPNSQSLLGIAYYRQGNPARATSWLKKGLERNPLDASAAYTLGLIHEQQGNHTRAINAYRRALESGGDYKQAEVKLSRLLSRPGIATVASHRVFAGQEGVVTFTDVTIQSGLGGISGQRVAWGDYDNDGNDDLLLDGTRLFRNIGEGRFREVSPDVFPTGLGPAHGGTWGDYDNDGHLDILATTDNFLRLLRNTGTGTFVDVSQTVLPRLKRADSQAAAWGHLDSDGYPDIYIANYQQPAVERAVCSPDVLLANDRGRRFVDASDRLDNYTQEPMCGRGVVWGDYDGDGRQDILVANYRLDPNFLWRNTGDKSSNTAREAGVAGVETAGAYGNSIGPVFADFNNDGRPDAFVANLAHPRDLAFSDQSQLLINEEDRFIDRARHGGIRFEETYSDATVADVDNDGDLDLYITAIYPSGESHLYLNGGDGKFRDASWLSGTRLRNTWGAAFSDYDNDGDMDLMVASENGIRLLRNDGTRNHWLKLRIRQRQCDVFALGTRVTLHYGDKTQTREITAGRGTGNQDGLDPIFGLGRFSGPVSIQLRNACGREREYRTGKLNRLITLED